MRLLLALSLLALLSVSCLHKDSGYSKYQSWIRDSYGRIVIYHGMNVSNESKSTMMGVPYFSKADLQSLSKYGFNLVRLLVFWDKIEPFPYEYNAGYVSFVRDRVQWLHDAGIDVLIDFHQDLYGQHFGGNGFPIWTLKYQERPQQEFAPWWLGYLQNDDLRYALSEFWTNDTLQSHYLGAMSYLKSSLENEDNIIGYDMINEPYGGNLDGFEEQVLTRFYRDHSSIFGSSKAFIEPAWSTGPLIPSKITVGDAMPTNCVYAPHYYDFINGSLEAHVVDPGKLSHQIMDGTMQLRASEAVFMKVPMLFGEWGTTDVAFAKDFVEAAEELKVGWCYYSFDRSGPFTPFDSLLNPNTLMPVLSRPYPQRIAGSNPHWATYPDHFELTYDADPMIKAPTIIWVPYAIKGVTINGLKIGPSDRNLIEVPSISKETYRVEITY